MIIIFDVIIIIFDAIIKVQMIIIIFGVIIKDYNYFWCNYKSKNDYYRV